MADEDWPSAKTSIREPTAVSRREVVHSLLLAVVAGSYARVTTNSAILRRCD
jgi:hypothetical protein